MTGVSDLIGAYAARTVSPAEAIATAATNIERNDPTVGSVVRLLRNETMRDSRSIPDSARPLWGVPFGVKDLIAVGGVPRGLGCPAITPTAPPSDAAVVRALRRAGAVPLATLRTYELGLGSDNPQLGVARNPYDLRRHPGGSSSGSAVAVASGQLPFALGTDTAGSVRLPAAWCNLTAVKLPRRSISVAGVQPLSARFDSLGIMARDARDLATVVGALLGWSADAAGPWPGPAGGRLRVGIGQSWFRRVDAVIRRASDAAFSVLSELVDLTAVDLPDDSEASAAAWTIVLHDAAMTYGDLLGVGLDPDGGVGAQLRDGQAVSVESLHAATTTCTTFRHAIRRRLRDLDLLVVPGPAGLPPLRDDNLLHIDGRTVAWYEVALHSMAFANIADLAVVTLPIGLHESLPMGFQVVARPGREADLLRLAIGFQEATGHHRARPAHYYPW